MGARITISRNRDGVLEIWLNPDGRDLLVQELQRLDEKHEHFHLMPEEVECGIPVQVRPYGKDDEIIEYAKVLFRPDTWDARYFPHVLEEPDQHGG
jgi:D-alanine-D-alanine ligase-like ATP-grasp enzyme